MSRSRSTSGVVKKLLDNAAFVRHGMNLWPPFLFSGIVVEHISSDWMSARVRLRKTPVTANYVGTQFGGSMFAMTDPFWMFLLMHQLGPHYMVWDKRADIDFISPGRTALFAEFKLDPEQVQRIRERADQGEKVLEWFEVELTDTNGAVVAHSRKQVYVRKKREKTAA